MARSAFTQLKFVHQLHLFFEMSDLATVIYALVTTPLDYCNALYMGLPLKTIWKLHLIQNVTARGLIGACYRDHIMLLLQRLAVCLHARLKMLLMTFKALFGSRLPEGLYLPVRAFLKSPSS